MSFGWRKSFRFLRFFRLNLSKSGPSVSVGNGWVSTNSRTRRWRLRLPFGAYWQSKGR